MKHLTRLLSGLILLACVLASPAFPKDVDDSSCWSEVAASNVCASPDGWAANAAPSALYAIGKETMGAITRLYDRDHAVNASTGSANAYVLTLTSAPSAYRNGQRFSFVANFANTGSATLNVSGLGAVTIQKQTPSGLANLASGDIFSGQHVSLEYDSGASVFVLLNPQFGGGTGTGSVTSVTAGTGLSGGTITGTGTISLTAPVTVPLGGTGATTLSAHGVVLGNGTSAVNLASPGTAGQVFTSNGASADPTMQALSAVLPSPYTHFVLLTSGTTWSVPAGVTQVLAVLQGGGGGGGGVNPTGGSANSAGGTAGANVAALVAVSGSVSYSIGAGGSAGNSSPSSGGSGGDTTFGTVTAKGGNGGASKNGTGSASGTSAPVAAPLVPAAGVAVISVYTADAGITQGSGSLGGAGTSSPYGAGGAAGVAAGSLYGGAGSGTGGTSGNSSSGFAGKAGCIVIFY